MKGRVVTSELRGHEYHLVVTTDPTKVLPTGEYDPEYFISKRYSFDPAMSEKAMLALCPTVAKMLMECIRADAKRRSLPPSAYKPVPIREEVEL